MAQLVTFLLPALPLLALLLTLLLGRYPGCEAIVRLSERLAASVRTDRGAARRSALPKPPRSFAPAGGLLIALGLAQRPPPVAA
ncbi:MAG TPA: hypothetical protein VFX35_06485 [Solirubrobacterales bacterium]|nr:hypothetical protein [Solirubrobacterales bacterium]